jgi:hypothetical protein
MSLKKCAGEETSGPRMPRKPQPSKIIKYHNRNSRIKTFIHLLLRLEGYWNIFWFMGVRLTSHWTAAAFTGLLFVPGWGWVKGWMNEWMNELFFLIFGKVKPTVEWYWQGKTEELGEKPVPVPLCPLQNPLDWPGREPRSPRWEAGD